MHAKLRRELDSGIERVESEVAEMYKQDEARAGDEIRTARTQLIAAERGAIQRALYDGLISPQTASNMIDAVDRHIDEMARKITQRREAGGRDKEDPSV